MEEDNDEQWLYGEDPAAEQSDATSKVDDPAEPPLSSANPPEPEGNLPDAVPFTPSDLEPPIINPPEVSSYSENEVVPGEEEILVPLDPPVISALEVTETEPQEHEEGEHLANGEATEAAATEEGTVKKSKSGAKLSEGEEEDDEDDNIDVVIGDIRTAAPNYSANNANLHIKRQNLLTLTKVYHYRPNYYPQQPNQQSGGKFAADDFESVGLINGVPGHEYNLDNLEDKPWRKPGADITDYFNYGFNEDTWRAYCERQKRLRVHESGSGLIPMNQPANVNIIPNVSVPPPNMMGMGMPDVNPGSINVIGNANVRRSGDVFAKENTIQVMTADRREYSKKNFTPDMSIPPPVVPPPFGGLPPGIPPPFAMGQYGPPHGEYFPPEMDPYYHSYESQDPSWGGPSWNANIDVKNMIPLSNGGQRSVNGSADGKVNPDGTIGGVKVKTEPEDRDGAHDRDRDRERGKSRDYDRERDRESRHRDRSHRHRSRSRSHERRSRKHKSRSRSPGYRSHKKKKSKKSERSKSDSD